MRPSARNNTIKAQKCDTNPLPVPVALHVLTTLSSSYKHLTQHGHAQRVIRITLTNDNSYWHADTTKRSLPFVNCIMTKFKFLNEKYTIHVQYINIHLHECKTKTIFQRIFSFSLFDKDLAESHEGVTHELKKI
jgi:hypothetical protein